MSEDFTADTEAWCDGHAIARAECGCDFSPNTPNTPNTPIAWEEPDDLDAFSPPPLPKAVLAGPIGAIAEAVALTYQLPVDFTWLTALGVVSGATLNRGTLIVDRPRGWTESLALYAMPVLPSGSNKSSAAAKIVAPLRAWDQERVTEYRRSGALDDLAILEESFEQQRRSLVKLKPSASKEDRDNTRAEYEEARALLEQTRERVVHSHLVDDATPEALVLRLERAGALAMFSTEGGFVANLAGRYSTDPNLDGVLKAHDGKEAILVDRKGAGTLIVERPFITLVLGVQPDVLREVREERAMLRRGFLARFLTVQPDSILGFRSLEPPPLDLEAVDAWTLAVRQLLESMPGSPEVQLELELDDEARAELLTFRRALEPRLAPFGDLGGSDALRSWAGKLPGALARIAGLYTLADNPRAATVTGSTMSSVLELGDYFIGHSMQAHHPRGASSAARVLAWLRNSQPWRDIPNTPRTSDLEGIGGIGDLTRTSKSIDAEGIGGIGDPIPYFTTRDAQQTLKSQTSWVTSVDDIREALDDLERAGWLRKLPATEGKPGRPSERWTPHPYLLTEGDNR